MPKSAKRKKEKAADFTKVKLKLGKSKQSAANAVDTSFSARTIVLPSQSITAEKNLPTTRRKLTFDDLLAHLKHFNAGTRKDALMGLKEFFELHPGLLTICLPGLISATVRVIPDEDSGVRRALLSFYTWLMPRIPKGDIEPHIPMLVLFITLAQTHIFPEIRVDAVRFLNVFLEYIPKNIVLGWDNQKIGHGNKILKGYLGLLNAESKFDQDEANSLTHVVLTSASKLLILQSLAVFLRHALGYHTVAASLSWYMSLSLLTSDAFASLEHSISPNSDDNSCRLWKPNHEPQNDYEDFVLSRKLSFAPEISQLDDLSVISDDDYGSIAVTTRLARALHPILVSTFLDCAPSVFLPSGLPQEVELSLLIVTTELAVSLYGSILRECRNPPEVRFRAKTDLKTLLEHMSPYFPFKLTSGSDMKVESAFQNLGIMYCELSSLFLLVDPSRSSLERKDSPSIDNSRVKTFVLEVLGGMVHSFQGTRPLSMTAYSSLLPSIWSLINSADINQSNRVLHVLVDHAMSVASKSPLKRLTIEFVARLFMLPTEPQYRGTFQIRQKSAEDHKLQEWTIHLPKVLWEVGSFNLPMSEVILRVLLRLLQRSPKILHPVTISSLASRLAPYFSIQHAERGHIDGPFCKIASGIVRQLALDTAFTIMQNSEEDSLRRAVSKAVTGSEEKI